jgi:uncharacterized protein DUF3175
MATAKKAASKKPSRKKRGKTSGSNRKWSRNVTKHSNALDLENGVFKKKDPKKIAQSLKRSAEHSQRKKSGPYQSAMSMLNFYINRGGKGLSRKQKEPLEKAKGELRKLCHRDED